MVPKESTWHKVPLVMTSTGSRWFKGFLASSKVGSWPRQKSVKTNWMQTWNRGRRLQHNVNYHKPSTQTSFYTGRVCAKSTMGKFALQVFIFNPFSSDCVHGRMILPNRKHILILELGIILQDFIRFLGWSYFFACLDGMECSSAKLWLTINLSRSAFVCFCCHCFTLV